MPEHPMPETVCQIAGLPVFLILCIPMSDRTSKTLIIRLSSLGDVIMASSSLDVAAIRTEKADWLVLQSFAAVLEGHPSLRKVWTFDRARGFGGWLQLARELWEQNYDQVIDLHGSLRSRILRGLFFCWGLRHGRLGAYRWKATSKQRLGFWSLYLLKRFQPAFLRPERMVAKFARTAGGSGEERPDLRHLLKIEPSMKFKEFESALKARAPYLCVMPGTKWTAKKWPVDRFVELLKKGAGYPVVLGAPSDQESFELVRELERAGVKHLSAVGNWSLPEVARILAGSQGYLGNDTGLAHLAEAVGIGSVVIFGPTTPEMGFGPWRAESRTAGKDLWCRPCGKDGRFCYRSGKNKFLCMTSLTPDEVLPR
jgi:heptosyltransferase-2